MGDCLTGRPSFTFILENGVFAIATFIWVRAAVLLRWHGIKGSKAEAPQSSAI